MRTSSPSRRAVVRTGLKISSVLAAAAALALAGTGVASAHVSANADDAKKGGYAKVAFRVPSELPNAGTVKLQVNFPAEFPIASVRTEPVPGWTAEITKGPIDPPITVHGSQVSTAAKSITWTAQSGTKIGPTEFVEFNVSMGALPDNTDELVLPAIQTYDNGTVVNWDQVQAAGAEEPEHPAPTLKLAAAAEGGHGHDATAASASASASGGSGHDAGSAGGSAGGADNTARWLGGIGLVLGALGLGLGGGAVIRSRRSS